MARFEVTLILTANRRFTTVPINLFLTKSSGSLAENLTFNVDVSKYLRRPLLRDIIELFPIVGFLLNTAVLALVRIKT